MKLLTKDLRKVLPPLYSQENEKDPLVICKFFLPMTKWTWFATEFDGKDTFFGFVVGEYPANQMQIIQSLPKLMTFQTIQQ